MLLSKQDCPTLHQFAEEGLYLMESTVIVITQCNFPP